MSPRILSVVNITEDSFSDGGRYLDSEAALAQARAERAAGADILDLGAAASNIAAKDVTPEEEIRRLAPVVETLHKDGFTLSIDSFATEVQRWALRQGVAFLNDIQGFADPALYPDLAASHARLIVMHSVQGRGRATEADIPPAEIFGRIARFFEARIGALTQAGVDPSRLILDPGMGFFLGRDPKASFETLRTLPELKRAFALPVLIGVSRKSFLKAATGKASAAGAASLACELYAALQGADYLRTHEAGPLAEALAVWQAATSGKQS